MTWSSVCKLLQKQAYNFLSHRYGTVVLIVGCILVIVSAFQFGEVALEWSTEKYAAVFNSFSDNVAGKSFRNRLCLPVPIDVVYTWVNGTDTQLLSELRKYKSKMETEDNETSVSDSGCHFAHCVPANIVVLDPAIPKEITPDSLGILYPAFKGAIRLYQQTNPTSEQNNVTLAVFENQEQVGAALKTHVLLEGNNVSVAQVFYTSEWTLPNAIMMKDTILMNGFPHTLTKEELLAKIPEKTRKVITQFEVHSEKGVAVMVVPNHQDFETVLQESNITIDGKEPQLNSANLVWDLKDYSHNEDISASRFEDNEELRYSLRSIEQHAPWVRHVYIITNGQIPGWLNLDSPRLTIVTHQELFPNKSHLPTFSSPAIETHIHRIPGLSDKFIYLNDDVMFGKDVWPDDFYTHAHGQKVYLTWPIPNCQDGCPSTWIRDGYCDKACNNSACEWDGGDCAGGASNNMLGGGAAVGWRGAVDNTMYCNSGCANNWLADRYCDQACNVPACGFDSGDCGVKDFHRLHRIDLVHSQAVYTVPTGELVGYLNLTSVLPPDGSIEDASYQEKEVIRSVAVGQKFKVMSFVLHEGHNETALNFALKTKEGDTVSQFNFTLVVNTILPKKNETKPVEEEQPIIAEDKNIMENATKTNGTVEEKFIFQEIPEHIQEPKPHYQDVEAIAGVKGNLSDYELPDDIKLPLTEAINQLENGELTAKGFEREHYHLWNLYKKYLSNNNLKPVKTTTTLTQIENTRNITKMLQKNNNVSLVGDDKMGEKQNHSTFNFYLMKKQNKTSQIETKILPDAAQGLKRENTPTGNKTSPGRNLRKNLQVQAPKIHPQNIGNYTGTNYSLRPHKTRKLNGISIEDLMNPVEDTGFLPWERRGIFKELQKKREADDVVQGYESAVIPQRRLLDTFGDSLRHVNRLYNLAFGYVARKVPAHMPHMIDKHIMAELQAQFPVEWDQTSASKIRSSIDMQYAFAYFYYLMGVPLNITAGEVFDEMDKDHSGIMSDREIRTFATRLYDLPLDLQTLTSLENMLVNCSVHLPPDPLLPKYEQEKYYEKNMPQVTKHLVTQCTPLVDQIHKAFKGRTKYKYQVVGEEEISFKMIRTNVSQVVGQLDDIRKNPKKFICLNDNIEHTSKEAKTVKAVIVDFYESLFPNPSSFELPREYRNRFLHIKELRDWRKYRDWLKVWTQIALFFLIMFTVASFFSDRIEAMQKKLTGRRAGNGNQAGSSSRRQNVTFEV